MESEKLSKKEINNDKNKKEVEDSIKNKEKNKKSIKKKKNHASNKEINNGQDENINFCYSSKRSYSCRINESKKKKFVNSDEIKLNLNNKFMYLKTPQIKPKKSTLIPNPINLGSISTSKKNTNLKALNDDINIIKDIISEGENEESIEYSCDSSSFTIDEELKKNNEKEINENNEDEKDLKKNDLINSKIKSDTTKVDSNDYYQIEEENDDDFDENGQISLKNIRKRMIQSKKIFNKNDNDIFYRIDSNISEKYKKFKDDILKGNENDILDIQFHKTTGFSQIRRKNYPILEYLKKNSFKQVAAPLWQGIIIETFNDISFGKMDYYHKTSALS